MEPLTFPLTAAEMDGPEDRARMVSAAKTGDREAFACLLRQHERLVLATALRLLGNLADAEDAAQEVFLRLHRNLATVRSAGNFTGWLYRVTVNVCRDVLRKRPAAADFPADELATPAADPQQQVTEAERRRVLELALRFLSEKERAVLVLRDLEGLSTAEVAAALEANEATVRSQLSKARVKIRKFVEEYFRRRT